MREEQESPKQSDLKNCPFCSGSLQTGYLYGSAVWKTERKRFGGTKASVTGEYKTFKLSCLSSFLDALRCQSCDAIIVLPKGAKPQS